MGEVYRATDLALEPALRARWPHSIVTWNRLLAGRWLAVEWWRGRARSRYH